MEPHISFKVSDKIRTKTYTTFIAEIQYPQTPKLTDAFAPLLKRFELTFADKRKRYMDLMIGADSDTRSRRIKAITTKTGVRKAIIVINVEWSWWDSRGLSEGNL